MRKTLCLNTNNNTNNSIIKYTNSISNNNTVEPPLYEPSIIRTLFRFNSCIRMSMRKIHDAHARSQFMISTYYVHVRM